MESREVVLSSSPPQQSTAPHFKGKRDSGFAGTLEIPSKQQIQAFKKQMESAGNGLEGNATVESPTEFDGPSPSDNLMERAQDAPTRVKGDHAHQSDVRSSEPTLAGVVHKTERDPIEPEDKVPSIKRPSRQRAVVLFEEPAHDPIEPKDKVPSIRPSRSQTVPLRARTVVLSEGPARDHPTTPRRRSTRSKSLVSTVSMNDTLDGASRQFNAEIRNLLVIVGLSCYAIGHFGWGLLVVALILFQCITYHGNTVEHITESVRWELERQETRNKLRYRNGETVEWINVLVQQIWKSLDPNLFTSLRDTIEDTMTRCAPSIIAAADISSFELGLVAPRVDSINLTGKQIEDEDDVLIGEAHVSFRANSAAQTSHPPPHLLIYLKLGINAVIPVKVEFLGLKASVRFEIQTTGTPPFVSTARFSFISPPVCETSIQVLAAINLTQFPVIKQFLRETINRVFEDFLYPKAANINLAEMLTNDGVMHDTQTIGIVRIDVYDAKDMVKLDVSGKNDPYVVTTLDPSPYSSPPSQTKVIENCEHPIWGETHFHRVPQLDIVDEHIKLRLSLFDWDRFTADDHIGSISYDLKKAIDQGKEERVIHDGWSDIYLDPTKKETRGKFRYKIQYYPKLTGPAAEGQTSGILALQIHQAMNLQITAAPYSQDAATNFRTENASATRNPNPYVLLYVNDTKTYRTRAKLRNTAPYWNATTEQFIKDWKTATLRVVVKDQRDMEYDPVIGMVTISLKEIFEGKDKMELTKWYPLRSGIGCGKIRLSFMFKPVSMLLPPEEKGFDVGSLVVSNFSAHSLDPSIAECRLFLSMNVDQPMTEEFNTEPCRGPDPAWTESKEYSVFFRYSTTLEIRVIRRGLFGMLTPIGSAIWRLRNVSDCRDMEVDIPIVSGSMQTAAELELADWKDDSCPENVVNEVKGRLRFRVRFHPGLASGHELEIERSLTGAYANILEHNLARQCEDTEDMSDDDSFEFHVGKERRLNKVPQKQLMRQLKFVTDEASFKLTTITGKRYWDEYQKAVELEA